MERGIDTHEVRRTKSATKTLSKVNRWRDAWIACYQVVEEWPQVDLRRFHVALEKWLPILNWVFEKPIAQMEKYEPVFYYFAEPNGPKEIIQLYMEDNPLEEGSKVHIIFNLYEFYSIHKAYCCDMSKNNRLLVDEGRGTIHLCSQDVGTHPAEYFRIMTTWHLLFIYTLHALAHWDVYERYEHAHYDTHLYVRQSPFFKLFFYGQIVRE